ncbi:MAG: phosphohydrolase [Chlamydiae bacterium CG10_big_fil_rev_8_21_14_0_10_35_9]|nr:MAG: phosphohydrolase [Chlamydiae bacterium CG10_big_fil_rev_8_21_14_0_10_35_9]
MVKDFLFSEKKIYDSIHGFIRFDEFEKQLIDSLFFQRLHYIHQLGIAFMVYPGATHTRFEHSLGVMELSTRIFDKLCKTVRPDVFHLVPRKGSIEYVYWRRVLRMAALCHDLGHLPFSHVAEKDLLEKGHEEITAKIIQSKELESLWEKIKDKPIYSLEGRAFIQDVTKIAIGEKKWKEYFETPFSSWEKLVSDIITGDFFGADRIDYLLRDAKSTGVAYGLFDYHQLIEMLRILPSEDIKNEGLELGIDENGLESCEALLLARHFMHRRVYQYSSVQAYNFHLRRFMKEAFAQEDFTSLDRFLNLSDIEVIASMKKAALEKKYPGHEDAKRIIYRKERFKAFLIPSFISIEELEALRKEHKISKDKMTWEMQKPTYNKQSLSFPVARRHLNIQQASEASELLFQIPTSENTWLYIAPEYEMLIMSILEDWNTKKCDLS